MCFVVLFCFVNNRRKINNTLFFLNMKKYTCFWFLSVSNVPEKNTPSEIVMGVFHYCMTADRLFIKIIDILINMSITLLEYLKSNVTNWRKKLAFRRDTDAIELQHGKCRIQRFGNLTSVKQEIFLLLLFWHYLF